MLQSFAERVAVQFEVLLSTNRGRFYRELRDPKSVVRGGNKLSIISAADRASAATLVETENKKMAD